MTEKQKQILIILGIINVLVIGGLVGVVLYNMAPHQQTTATPFRQNPCITTLFDKLPPEISSRQVAWDSTRIELKLYLNYDVETPPEGSAQYLWIGLESIATALQTEGCETPPPLITVFVTAKGKNTAQHHVVQIDGESLQAWADGTLSDTELAEIAHYRKVSP
ncbi:MAG: hypothetical protein JXA21_28800 [Anaerolineae bacterium]|nr:hypothetical protein [Anaerolineae bacterium]